MIVCELLKSRFTPILATLLLSVQITACGLEEQLSELAAEANTSANAAVISGVDSGSVTEDVDPDADNLLEVSGKLNITDSDSDEAFFTATMSTGAYGNLTIDTTGNWDYAANNNQAIIQNLASGASLTDRLTVSSVDGTTHTVVIIIVGSDETNNAAVISGVDRGSVTEDVDPDGNNLLEIVAKLNISDSDSGEALFTAATSTGAYGDLFIGPAGTWYYSTNNTQAVIQNLASGATLTDSLTVSSVDGTTHTVVITIIGADETNNAAVISGVDSGSVTEDVDPDADNLLEVSATLNITDSDSGEASFKAATKTGAYGNLTIDTAGNWSYAANNVQAVIQNLGSGASLTDSLTVSSVDGTTHTVSITIMGADESGTLSDVSLTWVAPAEREDNSSISLSEIAGYRIHYGTTKGSYPIKVTVNDSTAEGHTLTSLPTGTYYFVVTTLDTEGRESSYSTEVNVVL